MNFVITIHFFLFRIVKCFVIVNLLIVHLYIWPEFAFCLIWKWKWLQLNEIFGIISRPISKCLSFYYEFPFFLLTIYYLRLIFLLYDIAKSQMANVNKRDNCRFEIFSIHNESLEIGKGSFFDVKLAWNLKCTYLRKIKGETSVNTVYSDYSSRFFNGCQKMSSKMWLNFR